MHSRRSWLRAGVMGPIGVALWRAGAVEAAIAQGGSPVDSKLASVKALPLAESTSLHGVFLDVLEMGVLITAD